MGGGGDRTSGDLQTLLQKIKSSEVVECRIDLINQLGEFNISDKSELASLVKWLADSTCLDVSQCMLNKSILHVAVKYLEKDISGCMEGFLSLGTKASIWCAEHFSMTLTSIQESQEEHSCIFFQLVLDLLSFSAAILSALRRSPVLGQKVFMHTVEEFILRQLDLAKLAISEIKMIPSLASEVLKVAQEVLNASVGLCRAYHQALNSESCGMKTDNDGGFIDTEKVNNLNHVATITTCTIDRLYELGILAATGGGSLVTILNVSWKGVVTLLQLTTGDVATKVNVTDILLTLISLATNSLRGAAESWSSTLKEDIALTEAKRTFLPVKFYLINAIRLLSHYPRQAFTIYKEIILCGLMISTFHVSLSKATHLKASSEALTELLEPTSILLLHSILNSVEVNQESKIQILDWLFTDADHTSPIYLEEMNISSTTSMKEIFSVTCESLPTTRILLIGRVLLFLDLLKSSPDLGEEVRLGIARKLNWLFCCLIDGHVYSIVLDLHMPVVKAVGSASELGWQPIFLSVMHTLKTFMIVVSSTLAWEEVETFLLENLCHPHFFLQEIVTELWCFFVRHAEIEMVKNTIDQLLSILKLMVSSEPALMPGSALRNMARCICMLITNAPQSIVDQVYSSIVTDDRSPTTSIIYINLLIEGFPLNLLSDKLKKLAAKRLITGYHSFMESNVKKLQVDNFSGSCSSSVLGGPVYALSSALHCLQISSSDVDDKTLKFTLALIHGCRNTTESLKDTYCKILNQTLAIISIMKHLYASSQMREVILELHTLFSMRSVPTDARLNQCKPGLALFMAGLSHMNIVEVEGSPVISAICEIYHMLLRERHWASVHLAISAFGYFAARTSCSQLWRFFPHDAAVSFDIDTGSEANEDRFMSELKAFLEKEVALHEVVPCTEQLAFLVSEALILKELVKKSLTINPEDSVSDTMEIDNENQVNKKRKLPDEISEGMSLLQSGLKIMGDGLSQWQQQNSNSTEFQKFSSHLTCLEDVIAHLAGLAESG